MRSLSKWICVFSMGLSFFTFTNGSFADDTTPVQWEEIRGWRKLGRHWAGALNEKREMIAIYDLAFPTVEGEIKLGTLDSSSAGYGKVIELLQQARNATSLQLRSEGLNEAASLDGVDQAIEALQKLKDSPSTLSETQWWKTVPWKSNQLREAADAPQKFSLADINLKELVKGQYLLGRQAEGIDPSILNQLEFVKNSEGMYQFYLHPKQSMKGVSRPYKIADLRCTRCGYEENLLRMKPREAIYAVLSVIPIPYLSGLVRSAIDEYYLFQDRLLYTHQEMTLELIRSLEESSNPVLSAKERELALDSLYFARGIVGKPIELFEAQEKSAVASASEAANYLNRNSMPVTNLNPRFGLVTDSQDVSKIFCLSAPRFWNILATFQSFDSSQPFRIRNQRIAIETAHVLVQFLNIFSPIPVVGTIVSKAFDWLLESRMHTLQNWEARLLSHLYSRTQRGESWTLAIDAISQQAINPMEISAQERHRLVRARKWTFSIP